MFGVGTDYCLLLVSRYREELRRIEDKHDAMARALRRAGPAILASGLTVVARDARAAARRHRLDPLARPGGGDRRRLRAARRAHAAAGAAHDRSAAAASGRAAASVAYDPEHAVDRSARALAALRRPGAAAARARRSRVTVALFAVGALGLLAYKEDY